MFMHSSSTRTTSTTVARSAGVKSTMLAIAAVFALLAAFLVANAPAGVAAPTDKVVLNPSGGTTTSNGLRVEWQNGQLQYFYDGQPQISGDSSPAAEFFLAIPGYPGGPYSFRGVSSPVVANSGTRVLQTLGTTVAGVSYYLNVTLDYTAPAREMQVRATLDTDDPAASPLAFFYWGENARVMGNEIGNGYTQMYNGRPEVGAQNTVGMAGWARYNGGPAWSGMFAGDATQYWQAPQQAVEYTGVDTTEQNTGFGWNATVDPRVASPFDFQVGLSDIPSAPTELLAEPGNSAVAISFKAGTDGGSPILNYQYSVDNAASWQTLDPVTATSPVPITGLVNGQAYGIRLRAVNANGPGAPSRPVIVTPSTVPVTPSALTATPSDRAVTLSFKPESDGGSPILDYQVRIDGDVWKSVGPTAPPIVISGLNNGQSYDFEVRSVSARGASLPAGPVTATPRTTPSAPTGLVGTSRDASAGIAFTPGYDGGAAITNYEYSLDGLPWVAFSPAQAGSPVTVPGLTNGVTYSIRLRAVNEAGPGAPSDPVSVKPMAVPSAPTNIVANAGDAAIAVQFTPGFDGGTPISNYEYSLDNGATWTAMSPVVTTSPFIVTGVRGGYEYKFAIRAVNAIGPGVASTPVVVPVAGPPAPPAAVLAVPANEEATVTITPGADGFSPLTTYEYSLDGSPTWQPTGSATPMFSIPNLQNGTTYTVAVRAVNGLGVSDPAPEATVTPRTTPGTPLALAVQTGYTQAELTFRPGSDGGSAITNYEYSLDAGATWIALAPKQTTSPIVINGLANGVVYNFALRAVNSAGPGTATAAIAATPLGAVFSAVAPQRVYDSRAAQGPLASGVTRIVPVAGAGQPVPAEAVAIAYNITIVDTAGAGFLAVAPAGGERTPTSTINWTGDGQVLANGFAVGTGSNSISVLAGGGGGAQFTIDIVGYYTPAVNMDGAIAAQADGDVFTPLTSPQRAYDSTLTGGPLASGKSRTIDVTEGGQIPIPAAATAVAYTVTETQTQGTGYLNVSPAGTAPGATSVINWYAPGQTMANSLIVGIVDGRITVTAGGGGASDFKIDILGYYSPSATTPQGQRFTPVTPVRGYDSRLADGSLGVGASRATELATGTAIPSRISGLTVNLTETDTVGQGYLRLQANDGQASTESSTINWTSSGQTMASGTMSGVGPNHSVLVTAGGAGGATNYVMDVTGYFN